MELRNYELPGGGLAIVERASLNKEKCAKAGRGLKKKTLT